MDSISFPINTPLWQIACVHGVGRWELRKLFGPPGFTETNSLATYGGEEDWWGFTLQSGQIVVICLRVPYNDAVVMTDVPSKENVMESLPGMLKLGELEVYEAAFPV